MEVSNQQDSAAKIVHILAVTFTGALHYIICIYISNRFTAKLKVEKLKRATDKKFLLSAINNGLLRIIAIRIIVIAFWVHEKLGLSEEGDCIIILSYFWDG